MIIPNEPRPRCKAHGQPESKIQSECYQWWWNTFPAYRGLLFAVTNQNERSGELSQKAQSISGAMRRAMGVYAGVSDMVCLIPRGGWHGLMLECKTPVGRQSDVQKYWQNKVTAMGYRYEVFRSLEQFQNVVYNYLGYGKEYNSTSPEAGQ